jgi:hypothetical protein
MLRYSTMPYNNMHQFFTSFFKSIYELGAKSVAWLFIYLTPLHGNLVTVYLLLVCDLVSGVTKARKNNESITAAKLTKTLYKFFFYTLIIVVAFQIDLHTFLSTSLYLTRIVCYYIVLIEFQSNAENVSAITGTDLWVLIKDKVTEVFNTKIKELDKKEGKKDGE